MRGAHLQRIIKLRILSCLLLASIAPTPVFGQGPDRSFHVAGVVVDPGGAVINEARVIIRRKGGGSEQSKITTEKGEFSFNLAEAGDYEIEAKRDGFKPAITQVTVGARRTSTVQIVLPIADFHEEIVVSDSAVQTNTNPEENLDVVKLDREQLRNLPVLGNDVLASATRLLDPGSIGSGGATIIVDGVETTKTKIAASQIKEVRINQNPYSAEFARPGRGRIEVITKPGTAEYHGEFNLIFRDHRLDARNAFATERPPEQRRIFEGNLTGPLGSGKTTSFLFNVEREEEDLQEVIVASTPGGLVFANVATPGRETELNFRIDHQVSKATTVSIRYELDFGSNRNEGVGGFQLQDVATNSTEREHELSFTHRRIMSATLVNEFTMRAGRETESTRSVREGVPKIIVLDAFTGGSGQVDNRETEDYLQLNEVLSWNRGRHFIRTGVNVPGLRRRALSDRDNFGGTFFFSTLDDFSNNRPFLFSINQGNGNLVFWQKEFGLFFQDNILVRPNLSIGAGLRYDWQNYIGDGNNFAPRISFAYAPDKKRQTVLRGGAGIFYDRTGSGPLADLLRFDGLRLRQVIINDPGFPDPLSTGGPLAAEPSNVVRFARDIRSPYTLQFNLGVERQLTRSMTATANYINTRGIKLFRSRDLNAPRPPFFDGRPDPDIGVLRQIESSARSQAHALELILRGRITRYFSGTAQYTLGRAYNDTSGINSLPANSHDLAGEWSRASFDERHRFNLLGTIEAGEWFNLGMTLSLVSGRPYSLTTGRDDNRDSSASDRPAGVRRNSLQGPGSATLDVRWSKEFRLKEAAKDEGPAFTIGLDAFNVLNRINYTGFVGNLSSPFFGLPVAARPARRIQLTLGFSF